MRQIVIKFFSLEIVARVTVDLEVDEPDNLNYYIDYSVIEENFLSEAQLLARAVEKVAHIFKGLVELLDLII